MLCAPVISIIVKYPLYIFVPYVQAIYTASVTKVATMKIQMVL